MKIKFPDNFLFGVATSAAQVEGAAHEDGRGLSIWDAFSKIPGNITDGSGPERACDMYHRYEKDLDLAREMNLDTFRFSFSWSRILPEGKGRINQKGLDYYKRFIDAMWKRNIIPSSTVYHWDLPYELERDGGWLNRDIVDWYGEYASLLFREFGNSVPQWATFNEPIAVYVGYALGGFAPGYRVEKSGRQANHNLLLAHGEGVKRFRQEHLKESKVGIVVDVWQHYPLRPDHEQDCMKAQLENEKTFHSYLIPVFKGCYRKELMEYMEKNNCMPEIKDGDMEKIAQPMDFFGLNCYNRVLDCADPLLVPDKKKNGGGNYLDNGTEYYPRAVYEAVKMLQREYQVEVPIFITENGTYGCNEQIQPDNQIHDEQRIKYLKGFLYWISKAMEEGADIRGYYVWSLLDNWEWSAGYEPRYGLVHVDYETQQRIQKDSAKWYTGIAGTKELVIVL